ncbi:Kinase-like protein [Mycena sanguinolenta]|uniref:Kinase-like protein n=1 Tax=Mycena sanguinolenta TaxID=230812 RepID=A0A8H7CZP4_9AGAR|nr:Kinase-like protein [Mycena sanguinolenta]
MDLQPDSDSEFAVVSTENAAVHPGLVSEASGPTSGIKHFMNPLDFSSSFFGGPEIGASSFLPYLPPMDFQPHSDPEFSLVSPDNAAVHLGPVSEASGLTNNQLFVNPLDFPSSFFGGPEIGASSLLPRSPPMDFQPHSDPEFSIVTTANNAAVHPGVVFGLTSNQRFMNPLDFPPTFFGGPRVNSELFRNDSGTRGRFMTAQMTDHLVTNNYHYYISGGVGGAGGIGRDKGIGGGGGTGHGPTVNICAPPREEESEFRTIRLGDIKLRKEISRKYDYGVVNFESGLNQCAVVRRVVRRLYSGEIHGDPAPVSVAIYEGDRAEERWRQDVARYAAIRHPNILQLYGLVNTQTLRAMVFHDGADY